MTTITSENFTHAMRQAVQERGEGFVYPQRDWGNSSGCAYSQKGSKEPGCLIGHALFLIDPKLLPSHSEVDAANFILTARGLEDREVITAAVAAQNLQDRGYTWGEALHEYETSFCPVLTSAAPRE